MEKRWYDYSEDEADRAASEIVEICDALEDADLRRARWLASLALYMGQEPIRVNGNPTETSVEGDDLYNLSQSAVDTAQAEIAARQRPKPMFLTSGGNYKARRRAKKLDRFVEAWLHQQHGVYSDAWELAEDAFKVASMAVGGVIKVCGDAQAEKIRLEHVPQEEIRLDPAEAERGNPQNWFHVYDMDLDLAINWFCSEKGDDAGNRKREAMLRASLDTKAQMRSSDVHVTRSVKIYEAYRLAIDDEKPGKKAFACSNGMLWQGKWRWDSPPWAIIVWNREPFGVWGRGLVEEGSVQHELVNRLAHDMHERVRLCASKRTYYVPGTIQQQFLEGNDAESFIPVTDLAQVPREVNAPPITTAEMQVLRDDIQRYYDMRGISQMHASSRKEPGVDAAIAMQTLDDINSVRFMPKARGYELLFSKLGRLIVRSADDMALENPGLLAKFPGAEFIEEIPFGKVSLQDDMYECRVAPVSSMTRDPAQRLQIATQLYETGKIRDDKYYELLNMPDLDAVLNEETAESRYVARLLNRYRDADDDDDLEEMGGFEEAESFLMNPLAALALSVQHYWEAKIEHAPEYNLGLLRRWMASLKRLMEKRKQAVNPPAPPVTGGPGIPQEVQPPPAGAQPPAPPVAAPSPQAA